MSNLYTQIDMLKQERDEARADRDRLAASVAALTLERDKLYAELELSRLYVENRPATPAGSTAATDSPCDCDHEPDEEHKANCSWWSGDAEAVRKAMDKGGYRP